MRIIFMGTGDFAVLPFKELLKAKNHRVIAAYTKLSEKKQDPATKTVAELAKAADIPILTPTSLKSREQIAHIESLAPDLIVVADYGLLLPAELLTIPQYGCINIHPSALPRWRGAAPIQRALMAGDRQTAVCIMQMDEGLDTGSIILQQEYEIDENSTAKKLGQSLAKIGGELLITALHMIENQYFIPHIQDNKGITYANKIMREDEKIVWSQSAWVIHCQIRALSPKPGAYFTDGQQNNIKIISASYKSGDEAYSYLEEMNADAHKLPRKEQIDVEGYLQAPSGFVLNGLLAIKCGDGGILFPHTVQRPGGKVMSIRDFVLGYQIKAGEILH